MRPISLAVDVTNYVMLELGQPLHAFDRGPAHRRRSCVRRARAGGEARPRSTTSSRTLDPDDLVVTDDSGPIGLAGVMGGASHRGHRRDHRRRCSRPRTGTRPRSPAPRAGTSCRARRPDASSAAVDPAVARAATDRAAALLERYGGATVAPGVTDVGPFPDGAEPVTAPIRMALDLPDRVAGVTYARGVSVRRLVQVGCAVEVDSAGGTGSSSSRRPGAPTSRAPPTSSRRSLRLEGYEAIPSELPASPAARGLTLAQRRRRQVSRALADAGYQEVLPSPFMSPGVLDAFGLDDDDPRRSAVRLANPLDADRSLVATTLLPGSARRRRAQRVAGPARPRALPHRPGGPAHRDAGAGAGGRGGPAAVRRRDRGAARCAARPSRSGSGRC